MSTIELVQRLEACWEWDTGFFGQLRQGRFDVQMFSELIATLESIDYGESSVIPRRIASLIWYMPIFMGWQKENIDGTASDLEFFEKATNQVQESVERILGLP